MATHRLLSHPLVALGAAGVATLLTEWAFQRTHLEPQRVGAVWILLRAAIGVSALFVAWRSRERLALAPLLGLTLAFQVAWLVLHLSLGVRADIDSAVVYPAHGNALLDGDYPRAEYPPGAVLLFGLDAWLGGGSTRTSHALVMIPFQLVSVACIWLLRARWSAWFAALVGMWPLNAYLWEFKFDLAPTALLVSGLLLASRRRWAAAGIALGVGTALKWTPALSFVALLVWLLASRRASAARAHALAFCVTVVAFHLPFLLWSFDNVVFAYTSQAGRGITAESIWYLPLLAVGLAHYGGHIASEVGAPGWADTIAAAAQLALLAGLLGAVVRVRKDLTAAIALAATAPVLFLLCNRVFSPQFLVLMLAAWAVAGALLLNDETEVLVFGCVILTASLANALVYPYGGFLWEVPSATLFVLGATASGWVVFRATIGRVTGKPRRLAKPSDRPQRSLDGQTG